MNAQQDTTTEDDKPAIPVEAARAVYAIMTAQLGATGVDIWTIMTSQSAYAEHAVALEQAGIALVDSYMGARSRDTRDKVGVFLSGKRVGLSILRTSTQYTAGSLPVVLKRLPGATAASRVLAGAPAKGLLIQMKTWLDATDMIDAMNAEPDAPTGTQAAA